MVLNIIIYVINAMNKEGASMKVVEVTRFGGPEVMVVREKEKPTLNPHQVLIQVAATSVNFADIKARYGRKGTTKPPFVPGLDVAGTIIALGSAVTQFQIGQRVIAFPSEGSYAEYVAADEVLTILLPDEVDFHIAAACPIVSFTSYKLLADVGRIEPGETVLIHAAAGGIGTTAIQMARILGASLVIGTVSHPDKMEAARQAGADVVIDTSSEDFAARVLDVTQGQGVDIVLDSIAGEVTTRSLECLAPYGRLVQFGNASGDVGTIRTIDLHSSCRSVLGFSLGTTRAKRPELLRDVAAKVLPMIASGALQIMIGHIFPLHEAAQAQRIVEGRQSRGKVLLVVELSN